MPHPGHHNIICPTCGTRMGGCRCMASDKATVLNEFPCENCKTGGTLPDIPLTYNGSRVGLVKLFAGRIEGSLTDPALLRRITANASIGLSVDFEPHVFAEPHDGIEVRSQADQCATCGLSFEDGNHVPATLMEVMAPDGGLCAPLMPMYDFASMYRSPWRAIADVIEKFHGADAGETVAILAALSTIGHEIVPKMPDLDGDEAECGHANPVWFAPNELWNEVMDPTGEREDILCPACFVAEAAKRGVRGVWGLDLDHRTSPPAWMLGRETEIAAALHGSVRDARGQTWNLHAFPTDMTKSTWTLELFPGDPESWTRINEPGPVTFA